MTMDNIEDIVRAHVPLVHGLSSKGWHSVYCEVCGDGSRTKGPRGGWLFEGDICFYNCFNCGIDGNFDPTREQPFSKDMYNVLKSFGIPHNDINELIIKNLTSDKGKVVERKKISIPNIKPPDFFTILSDLPDEDVIAGEARHFLWEKYKMKDTDYPFFLSSGKTSETSPDIRYLCKYLRSRIIIPSYQNTRMIYWQARQFVGESDKKYVSASVKDSSSVLYGMSNMFHGDPDKPLYITEGFFDSWHLHGVAVLGNSMKPNKIQLISRSRKPKVVVPDYNCDGMILANQAVDLGWGIALPDILPERDICSAINKFGKLYVLKTLVANTYRGFEAKVRLKDFRIKNSKILSG